MRSARRVGYASRVNPGHGSAATSVGLLAKSELPASVAVLAAAFRDNPLNRAAIASPNPKKRLRVNAVGMRALLPVAHARDGVLVARTHGAVSAALISAPPYGYPLPPPPFVQRLWCFLGQGVQVSSRWNQVFKVLNGAHPDEPHWYLSSLGVDPPFQGRGIGGVLLSAWLADVDRSADPAYLETDMEVNLDFYHREGFEPVGELDVLGVRVWCMRRLPRK